MHTMMFEIFDFGTPTDPQRFERHLRGIKGVRSAKADFSPGSVTIRYDENKTTPAVLEQAVRDCTFHCRNVIVIGHECDPPPKR